MLRFRNFGKVFDSVCLRYKRAFVIKCICILQQFKFEERLTPPPPPSFGFNFLPLGIVSKVATEVEESDKGNIWLSKLEEIKIEQN